MSEGLWVFMIDERVIDRTQRCKSVDRCLYFAEKLTAQPNVPNEDGKPGKIIAYCNPVRKN